MLRIDQLRLTPDQSESVLTTKIAKLLRIGTGDVLRTEILRRAVEYVNENYMNKLTLEGIADQVYLNKTYLSQLFTKQMNMSLGTYIENTRIKVAKNLLATTSMSISEIS